jgi:hypothetical protein
LDHANDMIATTVGLITACMKVTHQMLGHNALTSECASSVQNSALILHSKVETTLDCASFRMIATIFGCGSPSSGSTQICHAMSSNSRSQWSFVSACHFGKHLTDVCRTPRPPVPIVYNFHHLSCVDCRHNASPGPAEAVPHTHLPCGKTRQYSGRHPHLLWQVPGQSRTNYERNTASTNALPESSIKMYGRPPT